MVRAKVGRWAGLIALGLVGLAGCQPHDYGEQRGSIHDLDGRDRGLQAKDVNEAADQMAADLLSIPALNSSQTTWTVVCGPMEDRTTDRVFATNYDIFLQALRVRLARHGGDRITLITNLAKFNYLRNSEVAPSGVGDPYGQGGAVGHDPTPAAVNPNYALTGTVIDLPNRGTNYYQIEFSLQDLHSRAIVWDNLYAVKVAR